MSYDIEAHRRETREHCLHLVRAGGTGWHNYVRGKVKSLEKGDPGLHRGLEKLVEQAIQQEEKR